ncbi:class D sortase [Paenibacillus yanchengensis]|uniref:Class D sortase n=1 Tax=Paenibacillus yanchengensis TaxID=2035833 RepID=A0ABW4YQJ7_9BACL
MKKWLAYGLIIIGVFVIVYPVAAEWYDNRKQERVIAEYEEDMRLLEEESAKLAAQNQYNDLDQLFTEQSNVSEDGEAAEAEEPNAAQGVMDKLPDPIATINIPSIGLKLPILEGATQQNMKYAAAHLTETAAIGEVGNAAISAHRMRAKGRLFNRLDEVAVGDKITVANGDDSFEYTVYNVSVVDPTDVSVLSYNNTDKRLTLITCEPIVNPTHRLIVHAEIK